MTSYVHSIPGRLRLRSERLKADLAATAELQSRLRNLAGVTKVEFHATSSSLVVYYDPDMDSEREMMVLFLDYGYLRDGFKTNQQPIAATKSSARKSGRRNLANLLVSNVKHVAATSVATYLLEAAIIRFAPTAALPLMLLPLVRRGRPEASA
jgi:hypothetical protein